MTEQIADPYKLFKFLWPKEFLYEKEVELLYAIEDAAETYVQASNKAGKDYTVGRAIVLYFLRHAFIGTPPNRGCRILTTSKDDDHLRVLWGEINRGIQTAAVPLASDKGGPFVVNHKELRVVIGGEVDPISYVRGRVYQLGSEGEGLQGHHARFTLAVGDEASGLEDAVHKAFQGWAKRMIFFGNPLPCQNFYSKACKAGDLRAA